MSWQTTLADSLGLILVVWSIPVAIVLLASPILLAAMLVRWLQS